MEFRVRLKSFAGWGPYSKLSEPLAPLPSSTFAPETKAITSRGVEIRWHPLKDQRYGRTIRYTLNGKKAGQNSFSTIFIGKGLNCVVQAIGNKALKPNTTYVFELQIKTAGGDVHSQLLPVTTLAAPPDPPPCGRAAGVRRGDARDAAAGAQEDAPFGTAFLDRVPQTVKIV